MEDFAALSSWREKGESLQSSQMWKGLCFPQFTAQPVQARAEETED